MKTVVAKFGGSSLADAGQFRKVKEIVNADPGRRYIVVSAPGKRFPEDVKVTDMLAACYRKAAAGEDFGEELARISGRFQEIIRPLGLHFPLEEEMAVLESRLLAGAEEDYVLSRGEYLNAKICAAFLGFTFVDPEWCVCFDEEGKLDLKHTLRTFGAALKPLEQAVIAGFYGADMEGRIYTLSRGGSDVTGSLAAAAVSADLYENWTDVSGLLAADPRIVPSPKTVARMSYRELRTLSYMGASVLHTDAVFPVSEAGIPINIRNTNRPEDPGTMIVNQLAEDDSEAPIVGVAGRSGMSVIQVEKLNVSDESGFTALILDILKKRQLPFEQCLTGIDTVSVVIRSDLLSPCLKELLAEISKTVHPDHLEVKENLSMLAVIGEQGAESSDANVRVLAALAKEGIPISTMNQGAGKLNLLVGVPGEKYGEAVRAVYEAIENLGS